MTKKRNNWIKLKKKEPVHPAIDNMPIKKRFRIPKRIRWIIIGGMLGFIIVSYLMEFL